MRSIIIASVLCVSLPALAEDHAGHAAHHDELYKGLKQPGTGMSCCNNSDCRPAPHRKTMTGVEFFVAGRWIMPPPSKLIEHDMTSQSHWCGVGEGSASPITYCAIIPRGRI